MKKYFGLAIASVVAAGSISGAYAADLPLKAKAPPPPVVQVYNWTGFYVGGELGGLWAKASSSFIFPPPATYSNSFGTGAGGGFIGYQYQWNQIVLGVEANVLGLFTRDTNRSVCTPLAACAAGTTWGNTLDSAVWSVGPRLGWAFGQWMPYVTGGYAATRLSGVNFPANGIVGEQFSQDRSGWYAGLGIDWNVAPNWIVGVEYRHYDFGAATGVPLAIATGLPNAFDSVSVGLREDTFMVRGSYKFNWEQPVVAKY